jgi:hypothetical protein
MNRHALILVLWLIALQAIAQKGQNEVSIQALRTDLKAESVSLSFKYIPVLDSVFSSKEIFAASSRALVQFAPHLDYKAGTQDAFSYGILKLTGFVMFFKQVEIAGIKTPDTSKPFSLLPASVGIETNKPLSAINAIAEIGYTRWYQQPGVKLPAWVKKTQLGFFLQSGYKFNSDPTASGTQGGSVDESKEKVNSGIVRLKGDVRFDTRNLMRRKSYGIGFLGDATLWYDMLHDAFYYRLEGKTRVYFSKNIYCDFTYEKGSGAPNFNQGTQYGVGLTAAF